MSVLGELLIKLSANTASFTEGLSGAAKSARTAGREIEDSFSRLGSLAGSALAPFGVIGAEISTMLTQVGAAAGGALVNFGKLGGAMGVVAGVGGAAAAAMGVVSLGALALAAHTAESIAKLGELSQSTGVSVGALSGLGFAGKSVGIEMETMAKSLEKMDKAVFKAATSPVGTTNAFTRLQIALRDASGEIRPTEEIFTDLAGKFSAMPDGVIKTALAMEIFGRGGAAIIPLLNRGKEGIQEFLDTAKALGIVLDAETVAASEKFKESLATIEAAGTGVTIQLTKALLPALQTVADFLVEGLKDKQSVFSGLINAVATLAKAFIGVADTAWAAFSQISKAFGIVQDEIVNFYATWFNVNQKIATGDFGGAFQAFKDGLALAKADMGKFGADSGKIWDDNRKFIERSFAPLPPASEKQRSKSDGTDTRKEKDGIFDRIQQRINALSEEAKKWIEVAIAGTQAERLITEAQGKGLEEFNKLKADAARDKTGRSSALVLGDESQIKTAVASKFLSEEVNKLNTELDKQGGKFREDSKASLLLADAYGKGGKALQGLALGKQFAGDTALLATYQSVLEKLTKTYGAGSPIVKGFALEVAAATKKLGETKDAAVEGELSHLTAELSKETATIRGMTPYVNALNNAYLGSADAVRAARIEFELQRFVLEQAQKDKPVIMTPAQIQEKRTSLTVQDNQAYEATLKQAAAQYDLNVQYQNQVVFLERVREQMQEVGTSTLGVDAAIFDEQNRLLHQWDDWAFKVGTFKEKVRGVLGELVIQGRLAGQAMSQAFLTAIDGIEGAFAKLLTGQKANFSQVFQQLGESIAKAQIQRAVGAIAGHFGVQIPGLQGKADGSPQNPFHVVLGKGSDIPGLPGLAGQAGGGKGGWLGKVLGTVGLGGPAGVGVSVPDGTAANPFYVIDAASASQTALGGGGGGLFGSLFGGLFGGGGGDTAGFSMPDGWQGDLFPGGFGGGMAGGGDMTPGKWYIAGENGPEFIGTKKSGMSVTPVSRSSEGVHKTTIVNQFNGFKDNDMFRRSASQLTNMFHRQASLAYSRS